MALLDFPKNPTLNQLWLGTNGITYKWDGTKWIAAASGLSEAPTDGEIYGRSNATWVVSLNEAPKDGKTYGRLNGVWVDVGGTFVAKTGDRMSGPLQIRSVVVAPPPMPFSLIADAVASATFTYNGYANAAGTGYVRDQAGYAGAMTYSAANGTTNWWNGGTGAAGASYALTNTMSLSTAGELTLAWGVVLGGGNINTPTNVDINFKTGGASRATINASGGGMTIWSPNNTGLNVGIPTAAVHGIICTGYVGTHAILGYCTGQTIFGAIGANVSGQSWSVYGSASAWLASGSWQGCDARFKEVLDPGPFLPGGPYEQPACEIVDAIPVRAFKLLGPWAEAPNGDKDQFGWIAQEVEPVLPLAISDVGVAPDDLATRAFLTGKTEVPKLGTDEAKALHDVEGLTVKSINQQYMIAVLWGAVQELSAKVAALEAR